MTDDDRPTGRHAARTSAVRPTLDPPEGGVVALFSAAQNAPPSRQELRARRRQRRRGGVIALVVGAVVVAVVALGVAAVPSFLEHFKAKDYPGPGTGSVMVQVKDGQTADDIARTLVNNHVVASSRAFVNAAKASGKASQFQPGFFRVRQKMTATAAVSALLDQANRVFSRLTLPEGMIILDILPRLAQSTGVPLSQLQGAVTQLDQLGMPDGYAARSAEGFLYPQTYEFDPQMTAVEVLQELVAQFVAVDKQLDFGAQAKILGITAYQALIVASMIEEEAKFAQDMPKVARVIYNRIHDGDPVGIDATSVYGALITGMNPKDLTYNEKSPYNTRHKPGLPPTAISNPGEAAMNAAVHPTKGTWKWYLSSDAAGHLAFFDNYDKFLAAKARCTARHWGCG